MMVTRLETFAKLEAERVVALEDQDAEEYGRLCDELGICGDDIEDSYLYKRRINEDSFEEIVEKKVSKPQGKRVRKKQAEYNNLRVAANRAGVDVENVFADIGIKIRHLKTHMRYNHLFVSKGERISLEDAKPNRVGEAYKKCYDMGKRP